MKLKSRLLDFLIFSRKKSLLFFVSLSLSLFLQKKKLLFKSLKALKNLKSKKLYFTFSLIKSIQKGKKKEKKFL